VSLFTFFATFVLICLVFWAIRRILAAFGVGEPISTLVYVLGVILVVFWLLNVLGGGGGHIGSVRIP
jgi:hypothetical protein